MANNPVVIDPLAFNQQEAWQECRDYVDKCGGLTHSDGEPNWRAAFGADPGICSCPNCREFYWAWGKKQRCVKCGFEYPTNWWAMFSYGGHAAQVKPDADLRKPSPWYQKILDERMQNKYYRYAFENKCEPSMQVAESMPWTTIFPEDATHMPPEVK